MSVYFSWRGKTISLLPIVNRYGKKREKKRARKKAITSRDWFFLDMNCPPFSSSLLSHLILQDAWQGERKEKKGRGKQG